MLGCHWALRFKHSASTTTVWSIIQMQADLTRTVHGICHSKSVLMEHINSGLMESACVHANVRMPPTCLQHINTFKLDQRRTKFFLVSNQLFSVVVVAQFNERPAL